MTTQPTIDPTRTEAFLGKVLGDTSGMTVTVMAAIGDRLNLFKNLAHGPATVAQLANRASLNERYVQEWLGVMVSAGYIEYDPISGLFTLPAEHVPVLAQENGAIFFGGVHQMLIGMTGPYKQLVHSFRHGGGIAQSEYDDDLWDGMERFTSGWFENLLLPVWIPAMPEVRAKLEQGVEVADVGCGRGRALIKLAQQYPNSRYIGYDVFQPALDHAKANAQAAGVADRMSFQQLDASQGLPGQYDVITTFDVVHDAVDPRGLLRAIRQALLPDGTYVCLEINGADTLEGNAGPLGAFFYSLSVLYCMTTSLHGNGEGLGTVGMHEAKVHELGSEAGFSRIERVPLENPFNKIFELKQ